MPQIPRVTKPTVQSQVVAGPKAKVVDVSSGLKTLAGGVQSAGQDIGEAMQYVKNNRDQIEAENAVLEFDSVKNDILFNPKTGYYSTQGRNAVDGFEPTGKTLDDTLKAQRDKISNPQARAMFDKVVNASIGRDKQSMMRHSLQGQKTWEVATFKSQEANALANASLYYNDPERLKIQMAQGEIAVTNRNKSLGSPPEQTMLDRRTFASALVKSAINGAMNRGDLERAKELREDPTFGDLLESDDAAQVDKVIKAEEDKRYVSDKVAEIYVPGRSLTDMQQDINNESDDEKRKKIRTNVNNLYNMDKKARNDAQSETYETLGDQIQSGQIRVKDLTPEQHEALTVSQVQNLQTYENSLAKGTIFVTDETVKNKLDLMPTAEFAKVNMMDYRNSLSDSDFDALAKRNRAAREGKESNDAVFGRTKAVAITSTIKEIFGDKPDPEEVNAFNRLLRSEAEAQGITSMKEFEPLLKSLAGEVVRNRNPLWPGSTKYKLSDIPTEHYEELATELRRAGKPVNGPNMFQLYEIAKDKGIIK